MYNVKIRIFLFFNYKSSCIKKQSYVRIKNHKLIFYYSFFKYVYIKLRLLFVLKNILIFYFSGKYKIIFQFYIVLSRTNFIIQNEKTRNVFLYNKNNNFKVFVIIIQNSTNRDNKEKLSSIFRRYVWIEENFTEKLSIFLSLYAYVYHKMIKILFTNDYMLEMFSKYNQRIYLQDVKYVVIRKYSFIFDTKFILNLECDNFDILRLNNIAISFIRIFKNIVKSHKIHLIILNNDIDWCTLTTFIICNKKKFMLHGGLEKLFCNI